MVKVVLGGMLAEVRRQPGAALEPELTGAPCRFRNARSKMATAGMKAPLAHARPDDAAQC
jgi:hypothetical protein